MAAHVVLLIHFGIDDPKCECDYCSVDVIIDGEVVRQYSDSYHDKGLEKAESFADGYIYGKGKDWTPVYREVADYAG